MPTLQERIDTAVTSIEADKDTLHSIVHGLSTQTVTTDGGEVKTLAKAIADLESTYEATSVLTQSLAARDKAQQWAEEAENTEVETGQYSALHHAAKALSSATAAAASQAAAEAAANGIYWKEPVECVAAANITLSGEQTIDGVTTSASRVLVTGQTAAEENGVYVSDAGAWSRALPLDTWDEHVGAALIVTQGTTYADTEWLCTVDPGGTLDTTAISWVQRPTGDMKKSDNLAGLANVATARSNLGLGSAALLDEGDITGVPVGAIIDFAGSGSPAGGTWIECDGSAVSRTTYADLFTAIGTTWGVGDGSTTFNVPNLARMTTVGAGGTGTAELGNALGDTGGAETHTLAESEIPAHSHTGTAASAGAHTHTIGRNTSNNAGGSSVLQTKENQGTFNTGSAGSHSHSLTIDNAGGGGAHNNLQPSAVVRKMIKAA